jgi:hypothetical protein
MEKCSVVIIFEAFANLEVGIYQDIKIKQGRIIGTGSVVYGDVLHGIARSVRRPWLDGNIVRNLQSSHRSDVQGWILTIVNICHT